MKEIEIKYDMDPIERLKLEIQGSKSPFQKTIGQYLLTQLEKDEVLRDLYFTHQIVLTRVVEYVNNEAQEYLEGANGAIEDKVVFGWVLHYVQDGWKAEEDNNKKAKGKAKKEKPTSYTLTIEEETDLKEKAMKEFLAEEERKLREAKEKEEAKAKKAEAKARKKMEDSGQLSLWDFGGDN